MSYNKHLREALLKRIPDSKKEERRDVWGDLSCLTENDEQHENLSEDEVGKDIDLLE